MAGERGGVECRLQVSEAGQVTQVDVTESSGNERLDEVAREDLLLWRFEPKRVDGQPVATSILRRVDWRPRASPEGSSSSSSGSTSAGKQVSVGYTTYVVKQSRWSGTLSQDKYLNRAPNAYFLFVDLVVRNDDKKARTIPSLQLVDETKAVYDADSGAWMLSGSLGLVTELNPGVSKAGFVVFDVPRSHRYRLRLSGGFWSKDVTYVDLDP